MRNKTEQLKDNWTPALLMFRQEQTSLEGALRMLTQACKEAGLKFVEAIIDDSLQYNPPEVATHTGVSTHIEIEEIDA